MAGLFLGYLYFSIPRVILTVMASAEKLDPALEEAARSLGASDLAGDARRDAAGADARDHLRRAPSASRPRWAPSAPRSRSPRSINVLPITIYTEFTNYANFAMAASLSIVLGLITWAGARRGAHASPAPAWRRRADDAPPLRYWLQLAFTLLVCAFLVVPVGMSILAGVTENYFVGVKSGLTLRWVGEVWALYARHHLPLDRHRARLPRGHARARRAGGVCAGARAEPLVTRLIEELLVLPVAVPGLATALALILLYGGWRDFRASWTLHPGRPRALHAAVHGALGAGGDDGRSTCKTLEEAARQPRRRRSGSASST